VNPSDALALPVAAGLNATETEQEAPNASDWPLHESAVFRKLAAFVPVMEAAFTVTAAPEFEPLLLVNVTVIDVLCVPAVWLPKAMVVVLSA